MKNSSYLTTKPLYAAAYIVVVYILFEPRKGGINRGSWGGGGVWGDGGGGLRPGGLV